MLSRSQNAENKHQKGELTNNNPRDFCIMLQEIDRLFRFNELKSREYKFRFVRNLKSQKKGK